MKHEALRPEIRSISYSSAYRNLVKVARFWGLTPMQFDQQPYDDQVSMIAGYECETRIELLQNYEYVKLRQSKAYRRKKAAKG